MRLSEKQIDRAIYRLDESKHSILDKWMYGIEDLLIALSVFVFMFIFDNKRFNEKYRRL